MWFVRLLFEPFLALGAVVVVLAIFGLGALFTFEGLSLLPEQLILGYGCFLFGVGIFFAMILRGLGALCGQGASLPKRRRHHHGR